MLENIYLELDGNGRIRLACYFKSRLSGIVIAGCKKTILWSQIGVSGCISYMYKTQLGKSLSLYPLINHLTNCLV